MIEQPNPENRLIRQFASGSIWLGASSGLILAVSLLSQVALGWLLLEKDFGVFAVALGLTAFVEAFKDGGIGHWLIQRQQEDFDESLARSFWIAVGFSVVVAVLLAAVAPMAGHLYGSSEVTSVVLIIAASMPLSSYWTIASARLTVDLRFRALAGISIGFALLRTGLAVFFAVLGFGPLSFVIPLVIGHLFTSIAGYRATGLKPWTATHFQLSSIRDIFKEAKWAMGGTFAGSLVERADYAVLGLVIATPSVGLYYFAYQLPYRLAVLFFGQTGRVVVPLLVRVRHDRQRFQTIVGRGAGLLGVVSAPLFLGLALTAPDIEAIVWRGRWSEAVPPAQVFAALFPFEVLTRYASMTLRALGRFRLWTVVVFLQGVGLATAALIAGLVFGEDLFRLTVLIGAYLAVSGIGGFLWMMAATGANAGNAFLRFGRPYLVAAIGVTASHLLVREMDLNDGIAHLLVSGTIYLVFLTGAAVVFRTSLTDLGDYVRALRSK